MPKVQPLAPARFSQAQPDTGSATLAAQLYEKIRYDIILVVLQPGQKLTLDLLKERYDVGMTPLREALYRLSASMLVLLEDRRGFRVAPISPSHLAEVIKSREEVEVLLLRNALRHGDAEWEAHIGATYQALMQAGQYRPNPGPYTAEWEEAHRRFHYALLGAARLPMLEDFHRSLWDHCARYRNLAFKGRAMLTPVFEGHKQIMDAVLARDEALAELLLRRHISLATSHIMGVLFMQAGQRDRSLDGGDAGEAAAAAGLGHLAARPAHANAAQRAALSGPRDADVVD